MLQLILAKGLTTAEDLRAAVDKLESKAKDNIGARITVKAWTDPAFKVCVSHLLTYLMCSLVLPVSRIGWRARRKTTSGPA